MVQKIKSEPYIAKQRETPLFLDFSGDLWYITSVNLVKTDWSFGYADL